MNKTTAGRGSRAERVPSSLKSICPQNGDDDCRAFDAIRDPVPSLLMHYYDYYYIFYNRNSWEMRERETIEKRLSIERERERRNCKLPENENEEDEQGEKDGHVVHCAQHDDQLTAQVGHETDEFQDAQKTERPQNGQARTAFTFATHSTLKQFDQTARKRN